LRRSIVCKEVSDRLSCQNREWIETLLYTDIYWYIWCNRYDIHWFKTVYCLTPCKRCKKWKPDSENALPVLGKNLKRGGSSYIDNFSMFFSIFCDDGTCFLDRAMFSHMNRKLSPRPFGWYGWTSVYLENSQSWLCSFIFQDKTMFSDINRKLSPRSLKLYVRT